MIKTHKLSDAQAAVLSGPVEWNADGSAAVTSGRENTLASLRRAGFLAGNLLTSHGANARAALANGERKVMADPDNDAAKPFRSPVGEIRTRHAAAPVEPSPAREFKIHFGYSSEGVQCGATQDTPYGSACTLDLSAVTCDACRTAHMQNNPLARAAAAAPVEPVRADWETAPLPAPVQPTMCQDCETRPATIFDTDAPMCAECAGDVPVTLSRPMQTTGDSIPWGAEHVYRYSADWAVGLSHGSFNLYRFDETAAYGELGDGIMWYGVSSFNGSVPATFYVGTSLPDALRALAVAHGGHARFVDMSTTTMGGGRAEKIVPGEVKINFLGRYAESLPTLPSVTDTQTHVIKFTGDDSTMCGTLVRGEGTTLRVSVDPTDATCPDCIRESAALAVLDALVPDEEAMFAAYVEAVQNGGAENDVPMITTAPESTERPTGDYDAHMVHPDNRAPGGKVRIPGLDGVTVPLPPVVRVERQGRFLVASMTVHGAPETFRTANGPRARQTVETWARTRGVRPSARGWKWIKDGDVLVAPVTMV